MRIDLHTHSNASDGTQSPADVMRSAAGSGLDVVALTDHDTTAGWVEAAEAAAQEGIALVRGIEVSCSYEGISIHLLGYLQQPWRRGVLEIAEQVDADAFVAAGDLDPADKGDPFLRRGLSGLDPPCGRVVVGEGHDIQLCLGRGADHVGRRLLPV